MSPILQQAENLACTTGIGGKSSVTLTAESRLCAIFVPRGCLSMKRKSTDRRVQANGIPLIKIS